MGRHSGCWFAHDGAPSRRNHDWWRAANRWNRLHRLQHSPSDLREGPGSSRRRKSYCGTASSGWFRGIPTEGVLILKNKNIDFVDDNPDDGGGIRIIYPLLGEEVALRIPLEIQTLPFADSEGTHQGIHSNGDPRDDLLEDM